MTSPDRNLLVYHRFKEQSKLHNFFVKSLDASEETRDHLLLSVISTLNVIITMRFLFEPNNPMIVVCDADLFEALGVAAFHITELKDIVLRQMEPLYTFIPDSSLLRFLSTEYPNRFKMDLKLYPFAMVLQHLQHYLTLQNLNVKDPFEMVRCDHKLINAFKVFEFKMFMLSDMIQTHLRRTIGCVHVPIDRRWQATYLPKWAHPDAIAVKAMDTILKPFNVHAYYKPKPILLLLLKSIDNSISANTILSYKQIAHLMSKYVNLHRRRLCDPQHPKLLYVGNDILGQAFQVRHLHTCQITMLMRANLRLARRSV